MRVLIAGPYPREEGKIGNGVEAVTYYLAEGLASRGGHEVHVVTLVGGLPSEAERTSAAGVRVHLLPLWARLGCLTGFALDVARVRGAMRRISPDIVHVHTQTMYPHAALERGFPSVLTPHGVFYQEAGLLKGPMQRLQGRLGCLYERSALRRAKHIILLNRYQAQAFESLLGRAKVHFVDNPVDDQFFALANQEEPGAILFAGTIIPRKGLVHLVDAAAILRQSRGDFMICIVGPAADRVYLDSVKARIHHLGLEDRFEFTGMVTEDEIMRRYARCCALVLSSLEESAPMVISQAHAAGKPVVACAVGGVAEMVEDGVTGYVVPPADPSALAGRLAAVLSDETGRREMGKRARQVAEARYRTAAVVEKTLGIYAEVLGSTR